MTATIQALQAALRIVDSARQKERAAVVAFLKQQNAHELCAAIERGKHLDNIR